MLDNTSDCANFFLVYYLSVNYNWYYYMVKKRYLTAGFIYDIYAFSIQKLVLRLQEYHKYVAVYLVYLIFHLRVFCPLYKLAYPLQ